MVVSLLEMLDM